VDLQWLQGSFLSIIVLTVINFHFVHVKVPWEVDKALNEGLLTHTAFCETPLWVGGGVNGICGGWKDAKYAACSGMLTVTTDERCGACLCCAQRRLHPSVHSRCSRNGNICRKCVCLLTELLEGLWRVDSTHGE